MFSVCSCLALSGKGAVIFLSFCFKGGNKTESDLLRDGLMDVTRRRGISSRTQCTGREQTSRLNDYVFYRRRILANRWFDVLVFFCFFFV